ncbi:MAG: transposase [Chloroflexia bacterium]|nr:transposase [Chloroflexia bacterium]
MPSEAKGHPGVFFKLQLVMFFEGIRLVRRLIEIASAQLTHRWYLGYCMDEPLPNRSSLIPIRRRLGLGAFEHFCERVGDLCREADLVWGEELFFDAKNVEGNADLNVGGRPLPSQTIRRQSQEQPLGRFSSAFQLRPAGSAIMPKLDGMRAPSSYSWQS